MCSYDCIISYPLEFWPIVLSLYTKQSVASFRRAIAIGTLIRIMEKLWETYFWHTFEMKMPIDEAETVVILS